MDLKDLKILKTHPGCEVDLYSMHVEEVSLKPLSFFKVSDTHSINNKRNRFFSYKFSLIFNDIIIIIIYIGLCGLIIYSNFYL